MRTGIWLSIAFSTLWFFAINYRSHVIYQAHQTRGDLTAYAQGMWNTLHGNFMASTYNYSVHNYYDQVPREITEQNSNIFGIHFNPIILLFLPLYALFPDPSTLLSIQSILLAVAGILIYLLSKRHKLSEFLSLTIQLSFYLYLSTVSAALSQFHAYALAIFFGLLLILTVYSRKLYYLLALFLFLSVQENTSLIAIFYSIYLIINRSTRLRGIVSLVISSIYFVVVINWVIPTLNPLHHYLFGSIYGSPLGNSIPQIIAGSIKNPFLFVQTLINPPNLRYLFDLAIPLLPFILLSPLSLVVALSALAQNLLSSSIGLKTHLMHYESGSVPFLYLSFILGISLIQNKLPRIIIITTLLLTTLVGYKLFSSHYINPTLLTQSPYTTFNANADSLLAQVPDQASISTQDYLSAQLSSRKQLYQFPVYADQAEYVLLTKTDQVWPLTIDSHQEYLTKLRSSHSIVAENDSFVLFHRQ